jgi:hypothetical protein
LFSPLIDKNAPVAYRHDGVWACMDTFYDEQRLEERTAVADADPAWNAFRNHLVLEYGIPKYDGDSGSPDLFAALDEELARRKTEIIMRVFGRQECAAARRYVEGFNCRTALSGPAR